MARVLEQVIEGEIQNPVYLIFKKTGGEETEVKADLTSPVTRGAYGRIFRGRLRNGSWVAIKCLDQDPQNYSRKVVRCPTDSEDLTKI